MIRKIVFFLVALCIAANCQFTYNEEKAKDLAAFSIITYCSYSGLLLNNCGGPCDRFPKGLFDYQVVYNSTYAAMGIVGYSPDFDAIVISFRGTMVSEFGNIVRDLTMNQVDFSYCKSVNCKVHQGFNDHLNDVKPQVEAKFKSLRTQYPNAKVYITGHSLGAAMSTLAVPFIYQLNGNKKIDVFYNFESPRVGDKVFSDWFKAQNFAVLWGRITHGQDPVIQNPSSWWPFNYYHINQEIFYLDFSKPTQGYLQCLNAEDTKCAQGQYIALDFMDHMNLFGWDLFAAGKKCS